MSSVVACTDCTSFSYHSPNGSGKDYSALSFFFKETVEHLRETRTLGAAADIVDQIYDVASDCLEAGWDGYDSLPVNHASIVMTKSFVEHFPVTSGIPLPEIVPESNGNLALEWYIDKNHVFIARIKESGEIVYAGLFGANKTHGTEYFNESIPSSIINNLLRLYR